MPLIRSLALVVVAGLMSGCAWFSWVPFVGGDKEGSAALEPAALERFDEEVRVQRLWARNIGSGLGNKFLQSQPAVAADRIFAADGYGQVEALDRFTGKRLWTTRIGPDPKRGMSRLNFFNRRDPSYVTGGVGVAHGYVLIGTALGEVIALSVSDGTEVWRVRVGSEVLAPPVGGAGLVFAQTIDGRLLALERDDGRVRWVFDNPVPVLTLRGTASPVFNNGIVYAGFANGMVAAVRAENGEPIWQHRVMLPEGRSELERMVDVDGTPVLSGGILYVASYQGRIKALRASDGSLLWEQEMSSFLDLAEGYRQVYVVDSSDVVQAIDQSSAGNVWRQEGLFLRRLTSPVAFSNYLLVGDSEGYVHVLAQSDGRFVGRRKIGGKGMRSRPVVVDGTVYVLTNSGSLQALTVEMR